jgi:hypothetical protein
VKPSAGTLETLRFLNLLEPGRSILSITKTAMWVCVWVLVASALLGTHLDMSAVAAFFGSGALYAWRRYVFMKTKQPGTDGGLACAGGPGE